MYFLEPEVYMLLVAKVRQMQAGSMSMGGGGGHLVTKDHLLDIGIIHGQQHVASRKLQSKSSLYV